MLECLNKTEWVEILNRKNVTVQAFWRVCACKYVIPENILEKYLPYIDCKVLTLYQDLNVDTLGRLKAYYGDSMISNRPTNSMTAKLHVYNLKPLSVSETELLQRLPNSKLGLKCILTDIILQHDVSDAFIVSLAEYVDFAKLLKQQPARLSDNVLCQIYKYIPWSLFQDDKLLLYKFLGYGQRGVMHKVRLLPKELLVYVDWDLILKVEPLKVEDFFKYIKYITVPLYLSYYDIPEDWLVVLINKANMLGLTQEELLSQVLKLNVRPFSEDLLTKALEIASINNTVFSEELVRVINDFYVISKSIYAKYSTLFLNNPKISDFQKIKYQMLLL